jgi:integrase
MVANYADGKRRFDSYADEALAIESAGKLARQLSEREVLAAAMTNEQASEYAAAVQKLAPFNVALLSAADAVAGCLKLVGDLPNLHAAAKFYRQRHKQTTAKRVSDCVAELVALKKARGKSERYLRDLRSRLVRFAESFRKNVGDVTTAELQGWLDGMKLSPRSVKNYRAALETLFSFAESRAYIFKGGNPVDDTEKVSGKGDGAIEIFTPKEIAALLTHAPANYLPLLALGAFAGLRTAEAGRLEWHDIDLAGGFVTVAAGKAKTRSRRLYRAAILFPLDDDR